MDFFKGTTTAFAVTAHLPPAAAADVGAVLAAGAALSENLSNVNSGTYHPFAAKVLSTIAGWSYSDFHTFKDKVSDNVGPGVKMMTIQVKNEPLLVQATAQLIRTSDKKVIIVAFRGTELTNPVNWITDAIAKKSDFYGTGIDVHTGFLNNFQNVWLGQKGIIQHLLHPEMINEDYKYHQTRKDQGIQDEQSELKAIYFCGHSLGGAMAFLAGLYLAKTLTCNELFNKLKGVYTYGGPMVVDDHHRDRCHDVENLIFRHVYYNDIVPHLPPLSTGSFDHVGREFRYHPRTGWRERREHQDSLEFKSDRCTQVVSIAATAPLALLDGILDNINWLNFVRGEDRDWPVLGWFSRGYLKMPWSLVDHLPIRYSSTLPEITVPSIQLSLTPSKDISTHQRLLGISSCVALVIVALLVIVG